ncbi:hypothetical protein VTN02DRAFT_1419 [Thermoascus thermophilus]
MEPFTPLSAQHERLRPMPVSYVPPMNEESGLLKAVLNEPGPPPMAAPDLDEHITPETTLRVGVIGAGEDVAREIHLPTLQRLSEYFEIAAVSDASQRSVDLCRSRFNVPTGSVDAYALIRDPDIDLLFILTPYEHHAAYGVAALEAGKHVLIEEPIGLSVQSARRIIDAEKHARNGARVFVASVRRYAPGFVDTFKREIASIDRILYARCRDITGPKCHRVTRSREEDAGAKSSTGLSEDSCSNKNNNDTPILSDLLREAFVGQELTGPRVAFGRFLGSLGCRNLSLMRETLGFPESVVGVVTNEPFYSAIFRYSDRHGHPYSVTFESGVDAVPRFDAHLTVYGRDKTVGIEYRTPAAVTESPAPAPVRVVVEEMDARGELQRREVRSSYEDVYAAELKELYACLVRGQPIRTTAEDALLDLKLFRMMFEQYDRQCGTIRTPLG